MKLLIVEPHPDDAVLSCYYHILRWKKDFDIYLGSVGNNVYDRSSKKFCEEVGIQYLGVGMSDVHFKHRIPHTEVKKAECPWRYQRVTYGRKFGFEYLQACKVVEDYIGQVQPDLVVTSLGIYHPMHVITRMAVDFETDGIPKKYFVDLPYAFKKYGQAILSSSNHTPISIFPLFGKFTEEEIKNKLSMFSKCYPSERGLLRFETGNFMDHREIIMESNEFHSSVRCTHPLMANVLENR